MIDNLAEIAPSAHIVLVGHEIVGQLALTPRRLLIVKLRVSWTAAGPVLRPERAGPGPRAVAGAGEPRLFTRHTARLSAACRPAVYLPNGLDEPGRVSCVPTGNKSVTEPVPSE